MARRKTKETKPWGLYVIFVAVFLIALGLISRLFYLQILRAEHYREVAERQYIQQSDTTSNRGAIFSTSRNGRYEPLALMKETHILYIDPKALVGSNLERIYEELSSVVEIEREVFFSNAAEVERSYRALKRGLDYETQQEITRLNLYGVGTVPEYERTYPGGSLASHVVGFMSYSDDIGGIRGTYGIESRFDRELADQASRKHANSFIAIFFGQDVDESHYADVVLTLEKTVQANVERELELYRNEFGAERAGAIVMDPKTGKIVAMAASPGFDLNNFGASEMSSYSNPNVSSRLEMGSVIKPLTVAAGLDSGAIHPGSTFYDEGFVTVDGATIRNVTTWGRGTTTMQQVLSSSMNTGVSWIVQQMGKNAFTEYFEAFGLGEKTGIKLPGEIQGDLSNIQQRTNRFIEHFTASYGQGIATTPIATIRALASLGNGGYLVTPHIVERIIYSDGEVEIFEQPEPKRILKEKTSEDITRMLVRVTDEALLGGEKSISTHTVALKTGTAEIADARTGRYSETDFLHSYFGYFPAYDPEFIIFLYAENPKKGEFASQTLSDPFFRITNFLIDYYAIRPDR